MKNENTREQKLKFIFAQNPNDREFHVTSDHQAFRNPSDAKNHAKTLDDPGVKIEKREDFIQVEDAKPKTGELDPNKPKTEREELFQRFEELFGNKPAPNASSKTLKGKIDAEVARLAKDPGADQGAEAGKDPAGDKGPEGSKVTGEQ